MTNEQERARVLYLNDPTFHTVVDTLVHMFNQNQRDAVEYRKAKEHMVLNVLNHAPLLDLFEKRADDISNKVAMRNLLDPIDAVYRRAGGRP